MSRVLVVDDHAFIRRGVQSILGSFSQWQTCGEADSGQEAVRLANELSPDIVIMDVSMPGMSGIEAARLIHKTAPDIKIVLLTLHESHELVKHAFRAGACGYVLKSDAEQELIRALRIVSEGGTYVSPHLDGNLGAAHRQPAS